MKIIKPTKGVSCKVVIWEMYENYFIYFCVTLFIFTCIEIYLLGQLASDAEDSLKLPIFIIITAILLFISGVLYLYFTHITKTGETKNYPKGDIRISNKNF